ncbi:IS1634 family transposase, partial [Turicimonas muris]
VLQEDKKTIVRHLNKEIQKRTKRTVTAAFYDVTTYSFESRSVSEYKDFGLSKDHKVNEVQVVLGLVMDENGIPIDYELFAGNTSEFETMVPLIKKIKNTYHLKQLIVVADRGLNCAENLFALKEIGCDFVIAQKFKNSAAEIKAQILDPDNWEEFICKDDGEGENLN